MGRDRRSRIPFVDRIREWNEERSAWAVHEEIRADVRKLETALNAKAEQLKEGAAAQPPSYKQKLIAGVRHELKMATEVTSVAVHRRGLSSSHATAARVHFNAAYALWLKILDPVELRPHLPAMFAVVHEHLEPLDKRRIAVERIMRDLDRDEEFDESRAATLVEAVGAGHDAVLREKLRAASFVRIVIWMTVLLASGAVAAAWLAWFFPEAVPLCFSPQVQREGGTMGSARAVAAPPDRSSMFDIVCPTRMGDPVNFDQRDAAIRHSAEPADYLVIEIVGMMAAALAAAAALRKIKGTSTAFPIPVALAVLKLPTGALTAVLGLIFMAGAFVPGLSALDTSAQIIAWAAVFGYAQELFTSYVDRRGQAVLQAVRHSTEPMYPATTPGASAAAVSPGSATSQPPD